MSGKDRTGWAVTLEQARVLLHHHALPSSLPLESTQLTFLEMSLDFSKQAWATLEPQFRRPGQKLRLRLVSCARSSTVSSTVRRNVSAYHGTWQPAVFV